MSLWKETKGAAIVDMLEECGTTSLSNAIAAFQLLCLRPSIAHVSFLMMIDNGARRGAPRWQHHRFQTISSHEAHHWDGTVGGVPPHVAGSHCSSMKSWTLCYATDAVRRGSAADNRQLLRTFESFVFLAADTDKALLESSIGSRHLYVQRIDGYDLSNVYACLAVDGCGDPSGEYTTADLRVDATQLLEQFVEHWRDPFEH
jgi:hypothetical protein